MESNKSDESGFFEELKNLLNGLARYLDELEKLLKNYDNSCQLSCETEEDEAAYQLARGMITELLIMGSQIQNSYWRRYWIPSLIAFGDEIANLNIKKFGEAKIPSIKGVKSLLFAEQVYLPNLRNALKLQPKQGFVNFLKTFGFDFQERRDRAIALADNLQTRVNDYQANHPEVKAVMTNRC